MNEPPVCVRCGLEYDIREDCEPSPLCDICAQRSVSELLAALKEVVRISDRNHDAWDAARAAIAKAEGRDL